MHTLSDYYIIVTLVIKHYDNDDDVAVLETHYK